MNTTPGQSSNEVFDVVDANDQVIAQSTRAEVHAKRLVHRAVHILVSHPDGSLLLQQRSEHKDTYPLAWTTSCAGHLDAGEGYLEAALREIPEELGVAVAADELRFLGKYPPSAETGWEFIEVYGLTHSGPFSAPPDEVRDLRFVPMQDLREWILREPDAFAPSFLYVLRNQHPGFAG